MISITINGLTPSKVQQVASFLQSLETEQAVPTTRPAPAADAPVAPVVAVSTAPAPDTPVATVPPVPAPQPVWPFPDAQSSVELDANGFPWDARIHSDSKNKIGDGTWRYKRNVDKDLVARIEHEMRQVMSAPAPAATVSPAPAATVPPAPAATVPPAPAAAVPPAPAAAVPPAPAAAVPPAPAAAVSPAELPPKNPFQVLMEFATPLLTSGQIQQGQVTAIVQAAGLPHIGALFTRQDLIPAVRAEIEKLIGGVV